MDDDTTSTISSTTARAGSTVDHVGSAGSANMDSVPSGSRLFGNPSNSDTINSEITNQTFMLLQTVFPEAITEIMLVPLIPFMMATFTSGGGNKGDPVNIGSRSGIFSAAFYLPLLIMNVVWGAVSDHHGRKPILLLGLLVLAISMFLLGVTSSFEVAVACRVLAGIFGANSTVAKGGLGELHVDARGRAWAYSYYGAVFSISGIMGPFIGGVLVSNLKSVQSNRTSTDTGEEEASSFFQRYPFFMPCFFGTVLALICVGVSIKYLREPRDLRNLRRRNVTRRPSRSGGAYSALDEYEDEVEDDTTSERTLQIDDSDVGSTSRGMRRSGGSGIIQTVFGNMLGPLNSAVIFPIILYMFIAFCNMAWATAIPLLTASPSATGGLSLSPFAASIIVTAIAISKFCTQTVLMRPLTANFGVRGVYRIGMSLVIPACLMFGMLGGSSGTFFSWCIILLGTTILGIAEATSYLSVIVMISDSVPPNALGSAHGLAATMAAGVRTIAPPMAGMLWQHGSTSGFPILPFFVISTVAGFAVLIATRYK